MSRRRSAVLVGAACALVLIAVFHSRILFAMGAMLVNSQPPVHADAAVTLGGDYQGRRTLKAAEMYRLGYVPRVLVSGGGGFYGFHESELAIAFAVRQGFPRDAFVPMQHPALSTEDELRGMASALRGMGIHKILLVTSPSHTARAARVARRVLPDIEVHPVSADDPNWHAGYWWQDREGRKTWLLETVKTVAYAFGL